jgi:hypothetical protein
MKHIINLNDKIQVQLTIKGQAVLHVFYQEIEECLPIKFKGTYIDFQLWEFMNIFGKHLWNGADQVIVNNEMEVL